MLNAVAIRPRYGGAMTPRVLSLSTLFPSRHQPNLGLFVERSLGAAVEAGAEVTVIAARGLPPGSLARHPRYAPLAALPEREVWSGLNVHRPAFVHWPLVGAGGTARRMARAVLPLARRLHAERPFELVDAQFFWPDGPVARVVAQALGLPYSVKARGADIHHWGHARASAGQVLEAGRCADGLLAVSAALRGDMVALGMPAERITDHPTGLDRARFRPLDRAAARRAWGVEGPAIASVGALIERKGQALVVDALTRLPGTTLLLAGDGPDRAMLEARAAERGVADRVRFLGAVANERLPQLLNAADATVMPSRSEGLANAWVESLACGTPLVISDAGGAAELVTDPAAGRIVAREPEAIAAAVLALRADAAPPERVAKVAAGYSWEANGAALVAHWRGLVRGDRPWPTARNIPAPSPPTHLR